MRAKFLKIADLLGFSPWLPTVPYSEPTGELTAPSRPPVGKVGDQLLK